MSTAALSQSVLNRLALSGIYILIALGLTLVMSIMGIVQVAHGEIYMIGAYSTYYVVAVLGGNFFLAIVVSTLFVGCLGVLLERLCFRPFRGRADRAFTVSIALILILQNVVLAWPAAIPGAFPVPFPESSTSWESPSPGRDSSSSSSVSVSSWGFSSSSS